MIYKRYKLICDDCFAYKSFPSLNLARIDGWYANSDSMDCYCPKCNPLRFKK